MPGATAPLLAQLGLQGAVRFPCERKGLLPQGLLPQIPHPAQAELKRMEKRNKRRGRCQYGQRYPVPLAVGAGAELPGGRTASPDGGSREHTKQSFRRNGYIGSSVAALSARYLLSPLVLLSPCPPSLSPPLSPRERPIPLRRSQVPRSLRCPRAARAPLPPL